jgi:hypothetical protein
MRHNVADTDPGSDAFLILGSGIRDGKKFVSGSGIRGEHPRSESLETVFRAKITEIF